MLKYVLASLALTVGLSHPSIASESNALMLKIEIPCGTLEAIGDVLKQHGETPALTAAGIRDLGGRAVTVPSVLFINPKTKSWTLVEQIGENIYCVPALGQEMTPYIPKSNL